MTKRKPGRPPKHASGAMTVYRLRVPAKMKVWLDAQGADEARRIIEDAMRAEGERYATCSSCGAEWVEHACPPVTEKGEQGK